MATRSDSATGTNTEAMGKAGDRADDQVRMGGDGHGPSRRRFLIASGTLAASLAVPGDSGFSTRVAADSTPADVGRKILDELGLDPETTGSTQASKRLVKGLKKALKKKLSELKQERETYIDWKPWYDESDRLDDEIDRVQQLIRGLELAHKVLKYPNDTIVNKEVDNERAAELSKLVVDLFANWTLLLGYIPVFHIASAGTLLKLWKLFKLWQETEELDDDDLPDEFEKFKKKVEKNTDGNPSEEDMKRLFSVADDPLDAEEMVATVRNREIPGSAQRMLAGERVNVFVGAEWFSATVLSNGRLTNVTTGHLDEPTLEVFTTEAVGRRIVEADDPAARLQSELHRENVVVTGRGTFYRPTMRSARACAGTQRRVVGAWDGVVDSARSVVGGLLG